MKTRKILSVILSLVMLLGIFFGMTLTASAETPFQTTPMIAGGMTHTLALKYDGTVWAWGYNGYGQLGDGTSGTGNQKNTPVQVKGAGNVGILTDVISVAAGMNHSAALKSDGTVWTWGYNSDGQLGDGTKTNRSTPVQVRGAGGVDFLCDIVAIESGNHHMLALKSDGTVWAWGYNSKGQLGDGTGTQRSTPAQVKGAGGAGIIADIIDITAGQSCTIALKSDGTVWAWGDNSTGQLGDGTSINKATPVQVKGLGGAGNLSGITAVSGGAMHVMALKSDGTVCEWGNYTTTPWQVSGEGGVGILTDIIAIAAGQNSTVLKSDGTVWAWRYKTEFPEQVVGEGGAGNLSKIISIATSCLNPCRFAVKSDGSVWAWGSNGNGQLGDGTTVNRPNPVQVLGSGGEGFLYLLDNPPQSLTTAIMRIDKLYASVNGAKVKVNDAQDLAPIFNDGGRTMVPFRFIATAFDAEVDWDGESGSAIIDHNGKHIQLPIDMPYAIVDGVQTPINAPVQIMTFGRTFVPFRAVAELLDVNLDYDPDTMTIIASDGEIDVQQCVQYYNVMMR